VAKSGGLKSLKALEFEKWGLEPSSLIEVYAYAPAESRGNAPVGLWGKATAEARYAYTICSGQTHFRDVFTEDIRCTLKG